jgi:hypothetical protein
VLASASLSLCSLDALVPGSTSLDALVTEPNSLSTPSRSVNHRMYYIIYKYYTASIYVIHTAYINKAYTINTTDVCATAAALDASATFLASATLFTHFCWACVLPYLEPFGGILEDQRIRALIGEYSDAIIKANMRETIPSDLTYDVSE